MCIDATVMETLGLKAFPVASQTYPRIQDYRVLSALAGLAASLHKFAFDLRIMQSAGFGEVREPMGKRQVGSSAMPFKRNPVKAENVCSLARYVAVLPQIAWHNAAENLMERTLDNSANRRTILPEAFLAMEEILENMTRIVGNLDVDEEGCRANLDRFGAFSASERVLMALVAAGADRQAMHEKIREHVPQSLGCAARRKTQSAGRISRRRSRYAALPAAGEDPRADGRARLRGHRAGTRAGDGGSDPRRDRMMTSRANSYSGLKKFIEPLKSARGISVEAV